VKTETLEVLAISLSDRELREQKVMDTPQTPSTEPSADFASRTTKPSKADNTAPVTGIRFTFLILSLTLASLLVFLDTSVVSTVSPAATQKHFLVSARLTLVFNQAVPKITDEFHSLRDVGWYGSAYQLGRYHLCALYDIMSEY